MLTTFLVKVTVTILAQKRPFITLMLDLSDFRPVDLQVDAELAIMLSFSYLCMFGYADIRDWE